MYDSESATSRFIELISPISRNHSTEVSPNPPSDASLLQRILLTDFGRAIAAFDTPPLMAAPESRSSASARSASEEISSTFDRVSTPTDIQTAALKQSSYQIRHSKETAHIRTAPWSKIDPIVEDFPKSPTSPGQTLSLVSLTENELLGETGEENLEQISPTTQELTPEEAGIEFDRRLSQPGFAHPLVLIEWYYTGHTWDDISRDMEQLQLQLSSHNIIAPDGTLSRQARFLQEIMHQEEQTLSIEGLYAAQGLSFPFSQRTRTPRTPRTPRTGIESPSLTRALEVALSSLFDVPEEPASDIEEDSDDAVDATIDVDLGQNKDLTASPSSTRSSNKWQWPKRESAVPSPSNTDGEYDRTFHLQQLKPLPEFRRLRSLKLTEMVESHQPDIWLAVWVNFNLETLVLEMKNRPRCKTQIGSTICVNIGPGWVRSHQFEGKEVYLGNGNGRLHYKNGGGEYLDKMVMEKAKVRAMAMGYFRRRLPVKHLVLSGFVVDSGPFTSWFGGCLRTIHFRKNCVDAGWWLPHHLAGICGVRHSDSGNWEVLCVPGGLDEGDAAAARSGRGASEMGDGEEEEEEEDVDVLGKPSGLAVEAFWESSLHL
ncbi:unnamed protein product [Penicillium olsonii]|nr:unnamed protein product [Penicillium olsonii]